MMNFFKNSRIRKISLMGVARLANGWTSAEEILELGPKRLTATFGLLIPPAI
jgi:hypothetical protein